MYFHTLCIWVAKTPASLHVCIGSLEPLLLDNAIITKKLIYASVTFATVVVRFLCLRFSLRFFRHRRQLKATTYVFSLLTITLRFLRRQTRTKPYRDLADIVRQPQGYRTIIVLSLRPPYINRTMPAGWPCGSRKESVRWLCNCRVIMCMDLNGHPCSFLDSIWTVFQSHVITNRAMKRLVFLVEQCPKVWHSVIRLCIF